MVTATALGGHEVSQLHKGRAMDDGRGERGGRRESHSAPLQWCSRDQSKTTALRTISSTDPTYLT